MQSLDWHCREQIWEVPVEDKFLIKLRYWKSGTEIEIDMQLEYSGEHS